MDQGDQRQKLCVLNRQAALEKEINRKGKTEKTSEPIPQPDHTQIAGDSLGAIIPARVGKGCYEDQTKGNRRHVPSTLLNLSATAYFFSVDLLTRGSISAAAGRSMGFTSAGIPSTDNSIPNLAKGSFILF